MKRNYKIYEKDGNTYVHYDGFPKGIKIDKDQTLYNYDWGWMTTGEQDFRYYNLHVEDWDCLRRLLGNSFIIEKDGDFGLTDLFGNEIMPCVFDQIEKRKESVFGRMDNSFWEIQLQGGTSILRGDYNKSGFFVQNGKKGWKENGKVIIPAFYDEIEHFENSNFYIVQKGKEYAYIDKHREPVLTFVRPIKGEKPGNAPFPFYNNKRDVIALQEYIGHEDPTDKNVVFLDGVWQRLDRISGDELTKILINPKDEMPLTDKDLQLFNNEFSYEFEAFTITSNDPSGVKDCLQKLQRMDLHSNTWHYIVKVWKAKGEKPTAEELRYLRYELEKNGKLGKLHFALGFDSKLSPGETKMLVVTHYNERFPSYFEADWKENIDRCSNLSELKKAHRKVVKSIRSDVYPQFQKEVIQNQWNWSITGMRYSKKRKWKDTLEVLDWLEKHDQSYKGNVWQVAEDYCFAIPYGEAPRTRFILKKMQWMLEHDADPNLHNEGKTALDIVQKGVTHYLKNISDKEQETYSKAQQAASDLLLKHGAKTMEEILLEEAQNTDYKVELKRMR